MKSYIQLVIVLSIFIFASCASDTTAEAPVTVETTNAVPAKAQEKTIVNTKTPQEVKKDPLANLEVGNYTGSTDMEAAKKGINAGAATKLGRQMGKRFCKCTEGGVVESCQAKIIKNLEGLKKTLHPKIAEACEKNFLFEADNCK